MPPSTVLWPLEPHTKGKHLVLKHYLDAWLPIRGMKNKRILFIDGFAGPGEYQGGEEGSPLIALRALKEHTAQDKLKAEVVCLFIEKDEKRAKHLRSIVKKWEPDLPGNCSAYVISGAFDNMLKEALNHLDTQEAERMAPAFVMVDPFGVSETPMDVIGRILQNSASEVYVSFMYESMNRFKATPEFAPHLDNLFGCKEWRDGIAIGDHEERKEFFYSLYEKQLRKAGAKYVVHFDLYKENRLIYAIFFGTKHVTGCDKMKQAIWQVAPFGDFTFRGTKSDQLTLGVATPDFEPLKENLRRQFRGKGWIGIEAIKNFVASDRTDYHTHQYKKNALRPMEIAGEIEVDDNTRKNKRTYPDGVRLLFLPPIHG